MKKIYVLGLVLLAAFMFQTPASALEVSTNSITKNIKVGGLQVASVDVTNQYNSTYTVTINSEDEELVVPGASTRVLDPSEETSFNLILLAPSEAGTYNTKVNLETNETDTIDVTINSQEEQTTEGYLQPTFSTLQTNIEQGTEKSRTFTIKNMWDTRIKVVGISFTGNTIMTSEGVRKPIGWEGNLGEMKPQESLTINLKFNTKNLDPGSYTSTMTLAYYQPYPDGTRKTADVNFNINVIESLTPGKEESKKSMDIKVPKNPTPGDFAKIELVKKETGEKISGGDITISVFNAQDEKQTSFTYNSPFSLDSYKYCVNATKEGYKPAKECFVAQIKKSSIEVSPPDPEPGDSVTIKMTDPDGNIVEGGTLTINNETHPTPQVTTELESGTYKIVAEADGYKKSTKSLEVKKELSFSFIYSENGERVNKPSIGTNVTVDFNKEIPYSVYRKTSEGKNTVVRSTGKSINFKVDKAGNYSVYADGTWINEFSISEQTSSIPILRFFQAYWIWIFLLGIGVLGFYRPGFISNWWLRRKSGSRRGREQGGFTPEGTPEGRAVNLGREEKKRR